MKIDADELYRVTPPDFVRDRLGDGSTCGGCVDVCPTKCLKIVSLDVLELTGDITLAVEAAIGADPELDENSAILKDEDRCIRCALCEMRCPVEAITMERVAFSTTWRSV